MMSDKGGKKLVLNLAESLALSVTAAAVAAGLAVAGGGGIILGLGLYSLVGSATLVGACSLSALDERMRPPASLCKTEKRRAYA